MRKSFILFIILLIFVSACSKEAPNSLIFQSEGDQWEAFIKNEVIKHDGRSYFQIHYNFKGNLEKLRQVDRITFSQGTSSGTQVRNIYDLAYKQRLVKEGHYQEENEEQYGIIIEDIKSRKSKEFIIEYDLIQEDKNYTNLNAIEKERILIQINWETKDNKYKDQIQ